MRKLIAVSLLVAGLAAGCGEKGKPWKAAERPPVAGVEVETIALTPRDKRVDALGTVRARTIAAVAPQVMGRVTSVPVSEGSRVEKGALLATIDAEGAVADMAGAEGMVAEAQSAREEAERAVAQAEAGKALAEKTYARYARLNDEKVVTRQEFDEVEAKRAVAGKDYERAVERGAQAAARIVQARSRADAARATLSHARVTAPFAGVVTEKKTDVGSMAVPGVPMFSVEDPARYRLEASVPEALFGVVKPGSRVEALLDSRPDKPLHAAVSEVGPAVDPQTRTFLVKADVTGPGLRTGMSGRLRIPAGTASVMSVPRRAIARSGGYDGVFVVTPDNVARLVMIRTGEAFGDRVEVLSGIEPGSRVAVAPLEKLVDGSRVEVRR